MRDQGARQRRGNDENMDRYLYNGEDEGSQKKRLSMERTV
mgnify:CR=1 FL=1